MMASLREVFTLFKEAASVSAPMLMYNNIRGRKIVPEIKIKKMIKMMISVMTTMIIIWK